MEADAFRFHTKALFLSAIMPLTLGCQPKDLTFELSGSDSIRGSVSNFSSISSASSGPSAQSICVDQLASLYSLDSQGKKGTKLLESAVDSSGNFSFSGVRRLGIDVARDSGVTKYVIEFSCGSSTYQRFVTGASDQKLSEGTTLLAWVSQTDASASVRTQSAQSWAEFYQTLESAGSVTAAFSALNSNTALKAKFQTLFGIDPVVLNDAVPKISTTVVPSSFNEEVGQAMSVQATHWSSTYNIAYAWKIGSTTLSNASNFAYTPSANSQGSHTIQLFIGRDDGSGSVDTSKPYTQETFPITVQNLVPPTAPSISRVSAQYTANLSATIRIATGFLVDGRPQNCKSFSNLALVEESFPAIGIAPLLPSSYNIDCTTANQQDLNVILSGTEGVQVLRLWARDAAGNISVSSQDVSITLDRVSPSLTLTSLDGGQTLRGGSVAAITWTATEANPATNPIGLEYSTNNGSSWTSIASSLANTGTHNWIVPSVNSSNVKVRVTMVDLAGNSGSVQSASVFTIDSTAPTAPVISRTLGQYSNSTSVDLAVTCDSDYSGIFLSSLSTSPLSTDSGWAACAATMQFTVSTGDGTKTIYGYSKDSAGNVSSSSSAIIVLDQTVPTLSLTSLNSSQVYKGGTSQPITWSATDSGSGFDANPITLSYSLDGGTNWTTIAASTANDGTEVWTFPAADSNNVKVKVAAVDRAGNISSEISVSSFTLDSSAPVVGSTLINDGAAYAGTALLNIKTSVTDNYSSAAQISVRLANANSGSGECQSEYSNDGWTTYTNATTNLGFTIAPVDGTKKICVWTKDSVGNISVFSPAGGTAGVDTDTIEFQIGHPPEFVGFSASRTSDGAINAITSGQEMKIDYSISDVEGLDNNPISIAYSTNNSTWKDIITNQDISDQANMTWHGGLSGNPTSATRSITTWTAPSSAYFRLKAILKDKSGNTSIPAMSGTLNLANWSVYAGSTDRGDGGTGKTAALYCDPYGAMFAINPLNGDVYAADCGYGLRKMSAQTGIVTTVIQHGGNNLPLDGVLPASPRFEIANFANPHFDSKGRLYISRTISDSRSEVYQIDFANNRVRKYLGGGYESAGGSSPLSMANAQSGFSFDEDNTLYFFTWCGGSPIDRAVSGKKLHKLTQNADGTAGTVNDVAGDCTLNALTTYGVPATSSTIGNFTYPELSSVAAWNQGQTIYVNTYGGRFKILNGIIYSSNTPTATRTAWIAFNPITGKLYSSNSTGGISITTPSLAGNGGETVSTWFNGNSSTSGCNIDDVSITNYCGAADIKLTMGNGQMFFGDGAMSNAGSNYSIRFVDSQSKIQTLMGSLPLYGDGKQKNLLRGAIAGIYYKKATEDNLTAFPEGLYFMERAGVSFNFINPTTGVVETLWGNQNRIAPTFLNGDGISKNASMGFAYVGGEGYALMFDSTGLPWMRAKYQLMRINASKQIELKTSGTGYWDTLADGANPAASRMYVQGTSSNIALKGQTFFAMGGAYVSIAGGRDPDVGIKAMDFFNLTTTKLFGGTAKYSQSLTSSADVGAGLVTTAPMWFACGTGYSCFSAYDSNTDRLYFSEDTKIRYITTPSNTITSTLVTLYSNASRIFNLTVTPDGNQIWFSKGNNLYCKDVSSGKSWCDSTTNYFQPVSTAGFSLGSVANQFTWKDNSTLFVSSNTGLIYQFNLPSGP